jgi:DNA-binding NarL/FixJ family response regulator
MIAKRVATAAAMGAAAAFAKGYSMIRVLLVDDQAHVRTGWRMRLSLEPDIIIAGEAADGRQAVELAAELQPDVVLMDVEMPGMDGITATGHLLEASGTCAVVVTSIFDNSSTRALSRAAGAAAFVGKQEPIDTLLAAIRACAQKPVG